MERTIADLSVSIYHSPKTEAEKATIAQLREHYENLVTSPGSVHHRTKWQVLIGEVIAALSFIAGKILGSDAAITNL